MAWTQDQIDRLRSSLTLPKRAGTFIPASDVEIVLGLIRFWRRATVQIGWSGPAEGMLPTIGSIKAQGVRGVIVECGRQGCGNRRKLSFDDLRLPDSVVFVEIARHGGFHCYRCGGRNASIVANYPNPLGPPPGASRWTGLDSTSLHASGSLMVVAPAPRTWRRRRRPHA